MKIISFLLCFCLIFAFPLRTQSAELSKDIVFGLAIETSDGIFLAPDFIYLSHNPVYKKTATEMAGLKLNVPAGFRPVRNGEKTLCLGNIDASTGCMEVARIYLGDLGWAYGKLVSDGVIVDGRQLNFQKSAETVCMENGTAATWEALLGKDVDCVCMITKAGLIPLAVFSGMKGRSSYTGRLMDNQVTGIITFEAVKDWGTSKEHAKIMAQTSQTTSFFEGCAQTDRKDIFLNRFGYCSGARSADGMFLSSDVVCSDIASATFGGRIFGLVVGTGADFFKVRTILPGLVPVTMKVKVNSNTKIVLGNEEVEFKKILELAPALNVSVEVIGAYLEDQFAMNGRLVRVNPREVSSYFCGIFNGDNLVDYFGNKFLYKEYGFLKLIYGQGAHSDGNLAEVWHYNGKVCAVGFPQVGILGLSIAGKYLGKEGYVLRLECKRAYDYNLFGRNLELAVDERIKFIEGGTGMIDPSSIETGTIITCWGFLVEGKFRLIMVNL